ncbi:MAG: hypothetical protein GF368_01810 [Candidatus Aenigmarchaeota archaeon]|nr:hypothetical protein [Candidatus Aenigmarchaeota archaeon]
MAKKKSKKEDIRMVENLELRSNKVLISINPKFYDLDVVYSSLYNFLEKCYCKVEGDPNDEILVELKPKKKIRNLERMGREFNNELINYAAVKIRGLKTEGMRIEIVKRALTSHQPIKKEGTNAEGKNIEGINMPWKGEP